MSRPDTVLRAEYALSVWTAWTCLFGIYQLWNPSGATLEVLAQFQSLGAADPDSLRRIGLMGYALVALSMVGLILQLGAGKRWPRFLLLVGFVIEVVAVLGSSGQGPLDYLADVPDFGLQGYALYLLYSSPGREWFARAKA